MDVSYVTTWQYVTGAIQTDSEVAFIFELTMSWGNLVPLISGASK